MTDKADTPESSDPQDSRPPYEGPTVSITQEMKTAYLDYAMSVIVSRAIPDLRDGLKPVHRRILHAMNETGNSADKPYRKSARPVGDVMGKYHPHGDGAIYDALVRMAQGFSMSLPLLDGQGNFGSLDGDNPAAMRYTEIRMAKAAEALLQDIDKSTVDFAPNYDGKDEEPTVLPSRFPNMLVNGAGGIAVGMATNIPPHNLGEVIDATLALIENPDLESEQLMEFVPAPDFPTGGIILGRVGAMKAYVKGTGSIRIRAKTRVEEIRKDRLAIIVDEIPYQVNKATMIERIAEMASLKKIEGVASISDESDRVGVRVVIELKRDATPEVVLNQLFRNTPLQTSFACNLLALNGGRPEQLTLRKFLSSFISFREEVVSRRTQFELDKARERSHVLCGLAVAVSNVDEVVATIRSSADPAEARGRLMERRWPASDIADYIRLIDDPEHVMNDDDTYNLSETQARAILELRLQRLTALGVQEVTDELQQLSESIKDYLGILRSRDRIMDIIKQELTEVREKFSVPRRTEIADEEEDLDDEDLIEREEMVVTVTNAGYIKRTSLDEYNLQLRGGKGLQGMATLDEDFVTSMFAANTHTPLLFFMTNGMTYRLKTWQLPMGSRSARGKSIVNIFRIPSGVSVAAIMPVDIDESLWSESQIVFATTSGSVRRNPLSDFQSVKSNGKMAMKLTEGVQLVNVCMCRKDQDMLVVTANGQAIRFPVTDIREFRGRESLGVMGIRLDPDDTVVSMSVIDHYKTAPETREEYLQIRRAEGEIPERFAEMHAAEELVLTVTAKGLGKISTTHDFPVKGRGGKGVKATDFDRRGGKLVACFPVEMGDEIMVMSSSGQSIRCPVANISFQYRTAGGVRVFDVAEGESVVSVARIAEREEESQAASGEGETGPQEEADPEIASMAEIEPDSSASAGPEDTSEN